MSCGAEMNQPACYYTPMLAEVNPRTAALLRAHTPVAVGWKNAELAWISTMHAIWEMNRLCAA